MNININNDYEMLEFLFNALPFVFWKNREGVYLGGNRNQAKEVGFDLPEEFIGKTIFEILDDKETAQLIDNNDNEVMKNGQAMIIEETVKIGNEYKTYLSQKHPVKDSDGNVVGLLGFSMDVTLLKKYQQIAQLQQNKFRKIVKQVMHDITSPITSIDVMISKLGNNIPEADRVTLRNAATRISGISQKLLSHYNEEEFEVENGNILVSLALFQIINEKIGELRGDFIDCVVDIDAEAAFIFIKHNPGIFKRMISNLVNNSVDAVKNNLSGKVIAQLGVHDGNAVLTMQDNGSGMPQHIIEKFSQGIAVTEGKEKGYGVGLTQIRDAIISANGTFKVYGSQNGTRITIRFPVVPTPSWLATKIELNVDDTIIILDDDESIHGSWDKSFESVIKKNPTLKLKHFYEGSCAIKYINALTPKDKRNIFLLTDFELLDQGINGLEVVSQANMSRAILVTSYSSGEDMRAEVTKAGIKILPKELVPHVLISVDKKILPASKKVDMVWVEDQKWYLDDMVSRHYSHLKVDKYYDPVNFMEDVFQYSLDTRIILDTYYESDDGKIYYDLTGYDIAQKLHSMGFTKLILLSGETSDSFPEYLTVARKIDNYALKNLDKI